MVKLDGPELVGGLRVRPGDEVQDWSGSDTPVSEVAFDGQHLIGTGHDDTVVTGDISSDHVIDGGPGDDHLGSSEVRDQGATFVGGDGADTFHLTVSPGLAAPYHLPDFDPSAGDLIDVIPTDTTGAGWFTGPLEGLDTGRLDYPSADERGLRPAAAYEDGRPGEIHVMQHANNDSALLILSEPGRPVTLIYPNGTTQSYGGGGGRNVFDRWDTGQVHHIPAGSDAEGVLIESSDFIVGALVTEDGEWVTARGNQGGGGFALTIPDGSVGYYVYTAFHGNNWNTGLDGPPSVTVSTAAFDQDGHIWSPVETVPLSDGVTTLSAADGVLYAGFGPEPEPIPVAVFPGTVSGEEALAAARVIDQLDLAEITPVVDTDPDPDRVSEATVDGATVGVTAGSYDPDLVDSGEPYDLVSGDEAPLSVGSTRGLCRSLASTCSLSRTGTPATTIPSPGRIRCWSDHRRDRGPVPDASIRRESRRSLRCSLGW